jgi:hypothetical protein
MRNRTSFAAYAVMTIVASGAAFAQSTGGIAADPNADQNRVPAPTTGNPSDPAAASNPAARAPTDATSGTGLSSGEAGSNAPGMTSPAGIPADPNTNENVQPGPTVGRPTDPAAGSNPESRVPTSPQGTGASSP